MSIEYGCATTNKFCFLDENEVEDPSELLAQVSIGKAAKDAKEVKSAKDSKTGGKTTKTALTKTNSGGKDGKGKQPLQQTDNSVKSGGKSSDSLGRKSNQKTGPREDKENTSNRPVGMGGEKRPRQDGRPPRQDGDKVQRARAGGQDRPPKQDRPPRTDRPPRRSHNDGFEGEAIQGDDDTGFRRNGGGGGGYRGPRTGGDRGPRTGGNGNYRQRRSNDPEHPRELDRHSGSEKTGIKAIDKKDGAGTRNWGTYNDELVAEETLNETLGEQSGDQEGESQNWASRVDESEDKLDENKEVVPNFMTLDEYKALKNEINKKNQFNIRQPGEGENSDKWAKYLLQKKAEEEEEDDEGEDDDEEEVEEDEDEKKKNKYINQIQIVFNEPPSAGRGGDRGDRGDRRGGERRGGGGGERRGGERRKSERSTGQPEKQAVQAVNSASPAPPAEQQQNVQQQSTQNADNESNNQRRSGPGGPGGQKRDNNRGGPGGQRGGQRGGRSYHQKVNVPRIEDEKDFPSLK